MKKFLKFITEESKPKIETTGHLTHAGDLLYYGDPNHAIEHHEQMFERLHSNTQNANHEASLKVDGGMSIVQGREEDGTPFVSYKSGKKRFYTPADIKATGKKHYEKTLIPALLATTKMNIKPGAAFQSDALWDKHPGKKSYTPNTIKYATGSDSSFGIAPHSQYEIEDGNMIKVSNAPDHTQLKSDHVYAPKLSMADTKFNPMADEVATKVQQHLGTARAFLDDDIVREFASTLPDNKKFHNALQTYSNHIARTSGERSSDDFKEFVGKHVARRKVSAGLKERELADHMETIENNIGAIDSLFGAHNEMTTAKHHMIDHLADHHDQFDIAPHRGEEHEGIVATDTNSETTAKFVREGPGGFAEKNAARTAILRQKS